MANPDILQLFSNRYCVMKASPAKCWLLIGSTPAPRFFRPAPTFFPLFHASTPKRLASNQKRAFRCRYKHPFSPTILLESLTSTDELIADSSLKQTPLSENSQTYIPNRQSLTALLLLLLRTRPLNVSVIMNSMNCVHHCVLT